MFVWRTWRHSLHAVQGERGKHPQQELSVLLLAAGRRYDDVLAGVDAVPRGHLNLGYVGIH